MKYWLSALLVLGAAAACLAQETPLAQADRFYVAGAVARPGVFRLTGESDSVPVLRALEMAGGTTRSRSALIVHLEPNGRRTERKINLTGISRGDDPDPGLRSNDVLFVPGSVPKERVLRSIELSIPKLIARNEPSLIT